MMFYGFVVVYLLLFILPGSSMVNSKALRKVVVKEIRFSVSSEHISSNVSVKNGVDNDINAPDTKLFQVTINNREKIEQTLLKQYQEHLRADPFFKESEKVEMDFQNTKEKSNLDNMHEKMVVKSNDNRKIDRDHTNVNTDTQNVQDLPGEDSEKDEDIIGTYKHGPTLMIVGGSLSLPSSWPWQVSIQYFGADNYWHHFCGGSLIHEKWVVTAAHCVCKLQDYTVRIVLGDYRLSVFTYREQVIDPARMLMHAYYEESSYYFDIAMVKLEESVIISNYVEPIEMSTPNMDTFFDNDMCYITGWGNTIGTTEGIHMSDYLLQSQVSVIPKSTCRQTYGHIIEDTQICITGENTSACSGDSGGPLVCPVGRDWKLAGIASWVGSSTCSPEYPNVYTRMSTFSEWAKSVMEQY